VSRITRDAQAIANGSGVATARIEGPNSAAGLWMIRSCQVQSTSALRCEAKVYRSIVSPSAVIGQTRDGRADSATGVDEIRPGEAIIVVWTGCTPAAVCTVSIEADGR
jgi:hypothetical protein